MTMADDVCSVRVVYVLSIQYSVHHAVEISDIK